MINILLTDYKEMVWVTKNIVHLANSTKIEDFNNK